MEEDLYAASIFVSGRVQGVGFRFFTIRVARRFGITGWVRNIYDGRVEIYAEGRKINLQGFIEEVNIGPATSHVSNIVQHWDNIGKKQFNDFSITF